MKDVALPKNKFLQAHKVSRVYCLETCIVRAAFSSFAKRYIDVSEFTDHNKNNGFCAGDEFTFLCET